MATKPTGMKPTGRPSDYRPEYDQLAENYAFLGVTDIVLAGMFNISERTLNYWKQKHPSFLQSIKNGREVADNVVVRSLYKRAIGYCYNEINYTHSTSETEEVLSVDDIGNLSEEEKQKMNIKVTVKQVVPDVTAQIFWMKSRRPAEWRDKKEIDVNMSGSVSFVYNQSTGNDPLPDEQG